MNKQNLFLKEKVNDKLYDRLITERILSLVITEDDYGIVYSGKKRVVYLDINDQSGNMLLEKKADMGVTEWDLCLRDLREDPAWVNDLVYNLLEFYECAWKHYNSIVLKNGNGTVPAMVFEINGIGVEHGKHEFGGNPNKNYFAISLGKVLYKDKILFK